MPCGCSPGQNLRQRSAAQCKTSRLKELTSNNRTWTTIGLHRVHRTQEHTRHTYWRLSNVQTQMVSDSVWFSALSESCSCPRNDRGNLPISCIYGGAHGDCVLCTDRSLTIFDALTNFRSARPLAELLCRSSIFSNAHEDSTMPKLWIWHHRCQRNRTAHIRQGWIACQSQEDQGLGKAF